MQLMPIHTPHPGQAVSTGPILVQYIMYIYDYSWTCRSWPSRQYSISTRPLRHRAAVHEIHLALVRTGHYRPLLFLFPLFCGVGITNLDGPPPRLDFLTKGRLTLPKSLIEVFLP